MKRIVAIMADLAGAVLLAAGIMMKVALESLCF